MLPEGLPSCAQRNNKISRNKGVDMQPCMHADCMCMQSAWHTWKVFSTGLSALRASTGLKPPTKSLESVCWLKFSTTRRAPTCRPEPAVIA